MNFQSTCGVLECSKISDVETDLLPSFCSHQQKTLLTARWAKCINNVGQCFNDGADGFRIALRKYSIEVGFKYKLVRNNSKRIMAVCFLKEGGCEWHVQAVAHPGNNNFYVSKLNRVHTCGAAVRTSKHPKMGSDIVSSEFIDVVREKPLIHSNRGCFNFQDKIWPRYFIHQRLERLFPGSLSITKEPRYHVLSKATDYSFGFLWAFFLVVTTQREFMGLESTCQIRKSVGDDVVLKRIASERLVLK
ncbi:hypothetical protein L1049_015336 [Liquidambar formosana]|uniref:Transposase MuDR plant domain-containing protein n=1 Tax=Liquidambar formosana TaxID=63359 RepID=A0AAP0X627_LIQFO